MGLQQVLLFTACAMVVSLYVLNPLPDDIEQPGLFSSLLTVNRIIEDLGNISHALGWKELTVFRRDMIQALFSLTNKPLGDDILVTTTTFGGVPVRIYHAASTTDPGLGPGFVYVHGGGYVMGSAAAYDGPIAEIVRDTGVVVMSMDYRLAPEHPSPAALHDCVTASSHFFTHAAYWGVDAGRIGVGGDSAGGNMAAVLTQKFRDMGGRPQFSYQVLIYPWTQLLDISLPSYTENAVYNMPLLKPHVIAYSSLLYLGLDTRHREKLALNQHVSKATQAKYQSIMDVKTLGSEHHASYTRKDDGVDEELASQMQALITDPYNFPLMAKSLEGLPPAFVATMGYDTLRDDGLLYSARLIKSGVKTRHYHDKICWHGSLNLATGYFKSDCGVRLLNRVVKYISHAASIKT